MSGSRNDDDKFSDLPPEIPGREISPHLPPESMGIMPRVSTFFHRIFSREDPWKINLMSQLGVKREVLDRLEKLREEGRISFRYQQLYAGYYRLKKLAEKFDPAIPHEYEGLKRILANENFQFTVLASCANDSSLLAWIPREMRFLYHECCCYANTNCVDENFLQSCNDQELEKIFILSMIFGNIDLFHKLLALKALDGNPRVIPSHAGLNIAAISSNPDIFREVLAFKHPDTQQTLTPDSTTLYAAALSGKLENLDALLSLKNSRGKPLLIPDNDTLVGAIKSGNLEMFRKVLKFRVPDDAAPHVAAGSGNLAMFHEIMSLQDRHGNPLFAPGRASLTAAIAFGDVDMLHEALSIKDKQGKPAIAVDIWDLDATAIRGDMPMFLELRTLENKDGKPIIPNINTLNEAAGSDNPELFHLISQSIVPDVSTLTEAINHVGNLEIVRALLALNIVPTFNMLLTAIRLNNIEVVEVLLDLKNEQGSALFPITEESVLFPLATDYMHPISTRTPLTHRISSQAIMNTALHALESGNLDVATEKLHTAYEFSPQYFFSEIKNILQNPKLHPLSPKATSFLQNFVADLVTAELELANPALPLCEIETLKKVQEEFPQRAEPGRRMQGGA